MSVYEHKPWRVAAKQWTGTNFAEVRQFVIDWIGPEDETGPRHPDDDPTLFQFYAWGDDQEVDPNWWIVVPVGGDGLIPGELMWPDDFRAAYEPVGADGSQT